MFHFTYWGWYIVWGKARRAAGHFVDLSGCWFWAVGLYALLVAAVFVGAFGGGIYQFVKHVVALRRPVA